MILTRADKRNFFLKKLLVFLALFVIALDTSAGASNIREVHELEFRGLHNLSRYEIMRESGVSLKGKSIIVDMVQLKKKLSSIGIIDSFKIFESKGRLIVSVNEKKIFASFALVHGKKIIAFEVDDDFKQISKNRKYSSENPFVLIGRNDLPGGKLSERVRDLFIVLDCIRKKNKSIFSELSEMYVLENGSVKLLMKNRKTKFFMVPTKNNFERLKFISGYLDKIGYYPEKLHITGNRIAIR